MELWAEVPGYPDYMVSDMGNVWSRKRNKPLRPAVGSSGYKSVILYSGGKSKAFLVHRLVMLAFVGPSDLVVNHENFDRMDNRLENLQYMTLAENNQWTSANKRVNTAAGDRHWNSKLTWEDVRGIRNIYTNTGCTMTHLASKYGVSVAAISEIVNNKSWVEFVEEKQTKP